MAERIRVSVAGMVRPHDGNPAGHVTISCGIATATDDITGPLDLMRQADRWLYVAKSQGRNRCRPGRI